MKLELDLTKSAGTLRLCLEKAGFVALPVVDQAFVLDVSGSFEDEHRSGITNALLTRLVPWGLTFDPDKQLEVLTFSHGENGVDSVGPVTADNYREFIPREVVGKVKGWCGGTDYSYVLEAALRNFGWLPTVTEPGFIGRLFGKRKEETVKARRKSLVFFVTDGDCSPEDKQRTLDVLSASESRHDQIYFLFIGVSNQPEQFEFLQGLGDRFSNTGFVAVRHLDSFVRSSDEELNQLLLGSELIEWLKAE